MFPEQALNQFRTSGTGRSLAGDLFLSEERAVTFLDEREEVRPRTTRAEPPEDIGFPSQLADPAPML